MVIALLKYVSSWSLDEKLLEQVIYKVKLGVKVVRILNPCIVNLMLNKHLLIIMTYFCSSWFLF